jgi:hypothetical protein
MGGDLMNHQSDVEQEAPVLVPEEVEVFINSDGTVSFADLAEAMIPVATSLNPTATLWCRTDSFSTSTLHDS